MSFEFADIVLYVIYLFLSLALVSVGWSLYRRYRRTLGRQGIQNGIRVRRVNLVVWLVLAFTVAVAALAARGDVVDIALVVLAVMLILASVVWLASLMFSFLRNRS